MMLLLQNILLFVSAFAAGASVFLIDLKNETRMKLLLSFSGAYLFAICVLHLVPEIYQQDGHYAGIYILIGFFLQILLEFFSEGIEHGHIHIHKEGEEHGHVHTFPLVMMLSLSIHSFLEGMPLSLMDKDNAARSSFVMGIVLHNIPISIALMQMFVLSGIKRSKAILYLSIFAIMAPLGSLISYFLQGNAIVELSSFYTKVMGIVIGIFLHISTTILFESNQNHRFNKMKFLVILSGALLAMLTTLS